MKIKKGSSKVKKKKNVNKGAAPPPLPPLPDEDPKDKLPKAYMDFSGRVFDHLFLVYYKCFHWSPQLEWSFYMNSLDLRLAAPKIRKIQIFRFLRSVLE